MDECTYPNPSTKNNLDQLQHFGNVMIPATSGELASGCRNHDIAKML